MSELKSNLNGIYKPSWCLKFSEHIILTKDLLALFSVKDPEPVLLQKLKRLSLPYELISVTDPRCFHFNNIEKELQLFPKKKQFILMEHIHFKNFLFMIGGTRLHNDLKKYYLELEKNIFKQINSKKIKDDENTKMESVISDAMKKIQIVVEKSN